MLLNMSWLREFVPYEGSAEELGERLTMGGLELEGISRPFAALRPIVVGHVVECGRHPEADKLSVCRVDVGDEVLDIVCGAPNVALGQKVPVVKVGTTLPNGLTIKKAKLRGAPSCGMICSESELGISDDHNGIMVLADSAKIGRSLVDELDLNAEVLDISITPNRGDCLSVLGLAREVSALFNLPLAMPSFSLTESGPDAGREVRVEVADPELCSLYQARVIEGVKAGRSPDWLRYRLISVGQRPISNLVDVTNYIMLELGQPLHAFDLDAVRGGIVRVAGAHVDEKVISLDGQERILGPADITIRDAERAIALGGVMGGLNSEITDASSRVFLEAAIFNPINVRRTARRLGLPSEASFRFERGVDQIGCTYAMNKAASMMAELAGGTVRTGVVKTEPRPWTPKRITLRKQRAEGLLGIPLDAAFCEKTLTSLGCVVSRAEAGEDTVWNVETPSHRYDLVREADLIEEVVRVYGVDKIPAVLPAIRPTLAESLAGRKEPEHIFATRVKIWGAGLGLNEAVNYSFVGHKELDHLGLPEAGRIFLQNPLSDELNVLRTALAPGLLNSLRNNLSHGAAGVRLFEVASTFNADAASDTTAKEVPHLAVLLYGQRYDRPWPNEQGDMGYQDIKGIVEHLFTYLHLPAPELEVVPGHAWLAPAVRVTSRGRFMGFMGKVKPALADPFHAKKEVWITELDLLAVQGEHEAAKVRFVSLPVFPPVRRDITFGVAAGVTAGAIIEAVSGLKLSLLEQVELIDSYEPAHGEKRLTFRLTFRHAERTLKDAEVDKQRDAVAESLPKLLKVTV